MIIYEYSSHECKQSKRHHHDKNDVPDHFQCIVNQTTVQSYTCVNLQTHNSICSYLPFFVFDSDMLCYFRDPGGETAMQQHVCRVFPQGRGAVEALMCRVKVNLCAQVLLNACWTV